MITEDYCSYEVAKLLKEKGFNEETLSFYIPYEDGEVKFVVSPNKANYNAGQHWLISAPTQQMVMKWLREEKGVYIEIRRSVNTFLFGAIIRKSDEDNFHQIARNLDSYEQAVEAALKYSLENLLT